MSSCARTLLPGAAPSARRRRTAALRRRRRDTTQAYPTDRELIMDSASHYLEAERLLRMAEDLTPNRLDREPALLQLAQVHATLALASATALSQGFDGPPLEDYNAWFKAASLAAPIPPETDATDEKDQDDEQESALRVGDLSPTGDMGALELAAWLRRVPLGSSLTDIDGDRWYRITTPTDRDPLGRHAAIARAEGGCVDDIDDHGDMMHAKRFAPFTVLAVGIEDGDDAA